MILKAVGMNKKGQDAHDVHAVHICPSPELLRLASK
jgi:hypothetical protein